VPLWEQALAQTTRKRHKALIQNNLAIAYEITGNLDEALKTITQAIENYKTALANPHIENTMLDLRDALLARLKQKMLIKEQLGE